MFWIVVPGTLVLSVVLALLFWRLPFPALFWELVLKSVLRFCVLLLRFFCVSVLAFAVLCLVQGSLVQGSLVLESLVLGSLVLGSLVLGSLVLGSLVLGSLVLVSLVLACLFWFLFCRPCSGVLALELVRVLVVPLALAAAPILCRLALPRQ